MSETIASVRSNLPLLLARVNVERAKRNEPRLTLRELESESGVSLSVLAALHTGKNKRIDFETINKLLAFFSLYIPVTTNDLLPWSKSEGVPA